MMTCLDTACLYCVPVDETDTAADRRWIVPTGSERWIDPAAPLHGWRFSQAQWDPDRGVRIAYTTLDPASEEIGIFEPPMCRQRHLVVRLMHSAIPDRNCACGYNVVPVLGDLLSLRCELEEASVLDEGGQVEAFWTLLRVRVAGGIARGAARSDPPGTIRAAAMELTGTVILDARAPDGAAESLASVGLLVRTVPDFWGSHTSCPLEAS